MKDRALRHLLVAAGRSVADLLPGHADHVAAAAASLRVERTARGRFVLHWEDGDEGVRRLPLDGGRFHLYARGDVPAHVARRRGTDHRGHNWEAAHAVWAEMLDVAPEHLRPHRRTFAPRPTAAPGSRPTARPVPPVPTLGSAALCGVAAATVAATATGRPLPRPATLAGAAAVVASTAGPDAPLPVRLGPLLATTAGCPPVWSTAAASLAASDVVATRLRGEPARCRRATATLATCVAAGLLAAASDRRRSATTAGDRSASPLGGALVLAAAAATVRRAPVGTRDRLSGWLGPLAVAMAAQRAEAGGDRSAPVAAVGVLGAALAADLAGRRAAARARPSTRPITPDAATAVPLPRRRSA